MGRCVIVCAGEPCDLKEMPGFSIQPDDYVICADGGLDFALEKGLPIHLAVGDFDSSRYTGQDVKERGIPLYDVASEKDDTDTMLAVKLGLQKGYRDFLLLCALGGRLDHTFANLSTLSYIKAQGGSAWLFGARAQVTLLEGEALTLEKRDAKLSVFSYTEECEGVTLKGVKYPLTDYTLTQRFPLGVSNEFAQGEAVVRVKKGQLLVMLIRE